MDAAVRHADGDQTGRCRIRFERGNVGKVLKEEASVSVFRRLLLAIACLALPTFARAQAGLLAGMTLEN